MSAWPPVMRAAAWAAGAIGFLILMTVAGRELSAALGTFEILFLRSAVGLAIMLVVAWRSGWAVLRTRQPGVQIARNVAHYVGQFGWFYALGVITLTEVIAIEFTTPIWTTLLAAPLLGERLTRPRMAAALLGFAGILIVLRPGLGILNVASLAVLGAAVAYALTYITTKRLTRTDSPATVLFYMTVLQLGFGLGPAAATWITPPVALWPWVLAVGGCALVAHYCFTRALALADASVVVPMDFLRLPFAAAIGALIYHEPIDAWVLLGAAVIVGANAVNLVSARRAGRTLPAPGGAGAPPSDRPAIAPTDI